MKPTLTAGSRNAFTILWTCLALCSCDSNPSHVTSVPGSEYRVPETVTLTVLAVRDATNGTVFEGTTNLPDNTKLGVELMTNNRTTAQDFKVYVAFGKFHSGDFRRGTSPLPPGKQKVHVFTYFNTGWQSESDLTLVGTGGSKLKTSAVIHSEDAQLIDGDKVLDYTVDLIIPPLVGLPASSEMAARSDDIASDKAINIVKKAILVVDGSKSSMSVEDGFQFYCRAPGIRVGSGWSATLTAKDSFNVVLDFIDGTGVNEHHETALWEVNVATKTVLYRNKSAKAFSWIPKD